MTSQLDKQRAHSHLFGGNSAYIEQQYQRYLDDPGSVTEHWQNLFRDGANPEDLAHQRALERFKGYRATGDGNASLPPGDTTAFAGKQAGVLRLVNAFRVRGHQRAQLDPLGLSHRPEVPDLEPSYHGLSQEDYGTSFNTGSLAAPDQMQLGDIVARLKQVYCGPIGFEYMHITETEQRRWIQQRIEGPAGEYSFPEGERIDILRHLIAAEGLERYLHTKYVGQKRFSLEGGEALIPLLHRVIQHGGHHGLREIVMGMAHRGRLNVLVNVLGKSPTDLFDEFEGKSLPDDPDYSGDVKYHLGYSSDVVTRGGPVHLALAFNPSHLEIIDPVVVGSVRSRQHRRGVDQSYEVMPILIHGDAAFAGQGVIMELFNMSQARGFAVGGSYHIIINNQIGFTTSNPLDARSTLYCTEVAKMVKAPIFHVNGDDPEAVIFAALLAADFRREFKKDVVLDLVCYRRHGHNEADEPAATQPVMYENIRARESTLSLYRQKLADEGVVDEKRIDDMANEYRDALDAGEPVATVVSDPDPTAYAVDWSDFNSQMIAEVDTGVPVEAIRDLEARLHQLPENLSLHSRVQKVIDGRRKMAAGEQPMDWGFAETMAYATLLDQDYHVRVVGQDSGRGTFFHRHAVLHGQEEGQIDVPLTRIAPTGREFTIIDSLLSEEAVLGFEYGYATADPNTLVIWEAQFGDFVNGAQVVIDQFITSGEAKWGRLCGLTMFLPHGYEGQGPEHSSARLERFLQLCAQNNIRVCVPTTPAQMFHMLRGQMLAKSRKPLIVMTPKSLLRHRDSVSALEDLENGNFHRVIPEVRALDADAVNRVVLCSGKVYYDLTQVQEEQDVDDVAIVRVEQLYPFPRKEVRAELAKWPGAREVVWCQEEPRNQGAWYQIRHHLHACLAQVDDGTRRKLAYSGRSRSASPATGHFSVHVKQQKKLVGAALGVRVED